MNKQKREERREKGLYWDQAWKLVEGCTKVSPGCDNCWSEHETAMRAGHPNPKISLRASNVLWWDAPPSTQHQGCVPFSGEIICREDNLDLPLRTKSPTVFAIWNDLFHEGVTDRFILDAYSMMMTCKQHTFLVLTKRAKRMGHFFSPDVCFKYPEFENIWHGVTVENQEQADMRIPHLLKVPGKKFLSIEPMLSSVDIVKYFWPQHLWQKNHIRYAEMAYQYLNCEIPKINAVLLGGESGKNARPMHPEWVRSVRDQCEVAGVPFTLKQWGEWAPATETWQPKPFGLFEDGSYYQAGLLMGPINSEAVSIAKRHNGQKYTRIHRVGKKKAGRILDGKIHDQIMWDSYKSQ